MKKIGLLLLCAFVYTTTQAQSLKKYAISNSGCSAYFFCDPGSYDVSYSEDSSMVYSGECTIDEEYYGVICIKLSQQIADLNTAEGVMESYLDFLKTNFKITSAVGYGKGHYLKERKDTRGMIDYWQDEDKFNWKVKAWTDGKYIAVLFAYSKTELKETKVNVFLDGFRLPGMQ